jgi:hypothetical protein
MRPAKSKGIRGIAYNAEQRTLDVEFASSKVYRYFDVPVEVYEWLARVKSKGRFVNRLVKEKYRYERVDDSVAGEPDLSAALRKSLGLPPEDDGTQA